MSEEILSPGAARPRRLRRTARLRDLVAETRVGAEQLIMPHFVAPKAKGEKPIPSMPGIAEVGIETLLGQVESEAEARREVLDRDFAGWTNIQEQISFSGTSLKERAERHLTPLRVAFENLESRGRTFLRETIRLRNLRLVGDQGRFKEAFEREVVRSAVTEIERGVDEVPETLARLVFEAPIEPPVVEEEIEEGEGEEEVAPGAVPVAGEGEEDTDKDHESED